MHSYLNVNRTDQHIRAIARQSAAMVIAGCLTLVTTGVASAGSASIDWDSIAACESGQNWSADTGNGYYGGLQFKLGTWRANGGVGMPHEASREEQIRVAEKLLRVHGTRAWPNCAGKGGIRSVAPPRPQRANNTRSSKVEHHSQDATAPNKRVPNATAGRSNPEGDYTINAGDTLAAIAYDHHVAGGWRTLLAKNRRFIGDPNLIFPGQKIVTY